MQEYGGTAACKSEKRLICRTANFSELAVFFSWIKVYGNAKTILIFLIFNDIMSTMSIQERSGNIWVSM